MKYKNLVSLDFQTKAERLAWEKGSSSNLDVNESSLEEAQIISKISNKPVFCTETFEMIIENPNGKPPYERKVLLI